MCFILPWRLLDNPVRTSPTVRESPETLRDSPEFGLVLQSLGELGVGPAMEDQSTTPKHPSCQ
jgi:hypothetical protein